MRQLSDSAIKQIAGRAGRFGLHDGDSVGVVTTLHEADLPIVRRALKASFQPLQYARLSMTDKSFPRVLRALPLGSTNATVGDVFLYVAKLSPMYELQDAATLQLSVKFIDSFLDCLTVETRLTLQNSPCPWRDGTAVSSTQVMMEIFREKLGVPIEETLHRAGLLTKLNHALALAEAEGRPPRMKEVGLILVDLETIHKVIVLYLWFSHRYVVAFPDIGKAFELRALTEYAMDWCLEVMHQMRIKSDDPGAEARQAVSRRREATQGMDAPDEPITGPFMQTLHETVNNPDCAPPLFRSSEYMLINILRQLPSCSTSYGEGFRSSQNAATCKIVCPALPSCQARFKSPRRRDASRSSNHYDPRFLDAPHPPFG